jgi:hypothetical protein
MEALKRDRDDVADLCSTPTPGRGPHNGSIVETHQRRTVERAVNRSRTAFRISVWRFLTSPAALPGRCSVGNDMN